MMARAAEAASRTCGESAEEATAACRFGPAGQTARSTEAAEPRRAPAASVRHVETHETTKGAESRKAARPVRTSQYEMIRSAFHSEHRTDTPIRNNGNRGRDPGARARWRQAQCDCPPAIASDKCGRAAHQFRSPIPHKSDRRKDTSRNARNRETTGSPGQQTDPALALVPIRQDVSLVLDAAHEAPRIEQIARIQLRFDRAHQPRIWPWLSPDR